MHLKRSLSVGAAALVLFLAASGCASGTDSVSTTPTPAGTTATAGMATPPLSPSGRVTSVPPAATVPHALATTTSSAASSTPTRDLAPQVKGSEGVSAGTALVAWEALPVKGRAPKTGYDRDQFGQAWADTERNGCDTRNGILTRDLASEIFKSGTRDCVVLSGILDDPYTSTEIHLRRGQDTSNDVQIDHILSALDTSQLV